MKKRILKGIAVYLALIIFFQAFAPTAAFALTSGPSQPEVESFEPVGTTQMVDQFTGDFNYNIPLLTVPGPNGGYPINLAYHAGIGLEQEASWVGLGWNINPGQINREMRGVPDEFNGDNLTRDFTIKRDWTLALSLREPGLLYKREKLGFDFNINAPSYQLYYNNYRGVGFKTSVKLTDVRNETVASDKREHKLGGTVDLTYDSNSGLGIAPSLSYHHLAKKIVGRYELGFTMNSREGVNSILLRASKKESKAFLKEGKNVDFTLNSPNRGAGVSFSGSSFVPNVEHSMKGFGIDLSFIPGVIDTPYLFKSGNAYSISYTENSVKERTLTMPAYGYLHLQDMDGSSTDTKVGMMDFNREKDVPVSKYTPSLPVPVSTYDTYMINGQGIGGSFRPFRGDIGSFYDGEMINRMGSGSGAVEVGNNPILTPPGNGTHVGIDGGISYGENYSGKWKDDYSDLDHLSFSYLHTGSLFENVYYKVAGEKTASLINELDEIKGEDPVSFRIGRTWKTISAVPRVYNDIDPDDSGIKKIQNATRTRREKRVQHVSTRSNGEIKNSEAYATFPEHVEIAGGSGLTKFDYASKPSHHPGEYTVLNPDGTCYTYGIPVYNLSRKDASFSITPDANANKYAVAATTTYSSTDNTLENNSGSDHLFTATNFPAYAYSYLLTSVVSPDYVDVTGDGTSEDDLGYYTKFNYTKLNYDYKWRIPYYDANYSKGYYSNLDDDKASYSYGTKEVYYVHSIETKTHIAKFILEDRDDGMGASGENNATPTGKLKRLKEIALYSKADPNIPIKKVHFSYTYDLCPGIPNSSNGGGKLTLKSVWFTYRNNDKGALSPYQFDYDETNPAANPSYQVMANDRWGNYKPNNTPAGHYNQENPYVDQLNEAAVDQYAGVWSLKRITLPSGGEINVTYESDDYAYVQDKRAMQMSKIVSITDETEDVHNPGPNGTITNEIKRKDLRIWFKMNSAATSNNDVYEYIKDVDEIYFRTFMKLKKEPVDNSIVDGLETAYDYVDGYAKVDHGQNKYGYDAADPTIGFITVQQVDYSDRSSIRKVHPFRKAGWQYIRMERPDLVLKADDAASTTFTALMLEVQVMLSALQMLSGYYTFANLKGWCNELLLDPADAKYHPSYIRLNSPKWKKLGGGHRVEKLTITDKWSSVTTETDSEYGQRFEYIMPDGSSSGVAEYEPLVGGEENPFRKPVWYDGSDKVLSFRHPDAYIEEPYCESLYPSANVGYRRVVVKGLDHTADGVTKSSPGISVAEFYTAKEFPVLVEKTDLQHKGYNVPLLIPFVGAMSFKNNGYSQGYKIELNDMHGKMKSLAAYHYKTDIDDLNSQPVSKTEYVYQTKQAYSDVKANYLDNTVTVLDNDGVYGQAIMGRTYDFYIDQVENSGFQAGGSANVNIDIFTPASSVPVPSFTLIPGIDYSESMFRSVATTKVIQKNGILSEVRTYSDGSVSSAKNLMYDSETGQALLTQVTNNFGDPVYTYKYAAHWAYDQMKGAYQNQGFRCLNVSVANGVFTYLNASSLFTVGDELEVTSASFANGSRRFWISDVISNSVTLMDETGSTNHNFTAMEIVVRNSGRKNQQAFANGTIVSLENPTNARVSPLFDAINSSVATWVPDDNGSITKGLKFEDCMQGRETFVNISLSTSGNTISFTKTGCETATLTFYNNNVNSNISNYTFTKCGARVTATPTTGSVEYGIWSDPSNCFFDCMNGVLHADAARFENSWSMNYADAGFASTEPIVTSTNGYRYGRDGVWRAESNHLFQIDRKQEAPHTDIRKDGTYENFVPYNWSATVAQNNYWTQASKVTQYSPYGFEVENINALGIYSCALYGYSNSLPVAVASNSEYREMAFDGFEDYTSTAYSTYAGHGHMQFVSTNGSFPAMLSANASHTGNYSLQVGTSAALEYSVQMASSYPTPVYFSPTPGADYQASVWVKVPTSGSATLSILDGAATIASVTTNAHDIIVEQWHKLDLKFTAPVAGNTLKIKLSATDPSGNPSYFDDIRIQPFKSAAKTYVYDPYTLWLLAELDDRNFATFYNYDESGVLVQVKKETEKGVMTLRTSRNNIKRNP